MPVFDLARNRTNVRTEILAGCTTFLTMAYIMFLNPAILAEADMDFGAVFVATCLSAAFGSIVMGLLANYPVALAPGMGLNAFFTFVVVQSQGASWQTALGAVFVAGVAFVVLSVLPVREWLINAIPRALKLGIAAGIGLLPRVHRPAQRRARRRQQRDARRARHARASPGRCSRSAASRSSSRSIGAAFRARC